MEDSKYIKDLDKDWNNPDALELYRAYVVCVNLADELFEASLEHDSRSDERHNLDLQYSVLRQAKDILHHQGMKLEFGNYGQ